MVTEEAPQPEKVLKESGITPWVVFFPKSKVG